MTDAQLQDAIEKLARIDAAGLLPDLEHDMAAWQVPFVDPLHGAFVKRIARVASRIFDVSPHQAERAAEVLLPTRQRHALELIDWYAAGLDEKQAADGTDAKLTRARRRPA